MFARSQLMYAPTMRHRGGSIRKQIHAANTFAVRHDAVLAAIRRVNRIASKLRVQFLLILETDFLPACVV